AAHDVDRAVRWLRAHGAAMGFDPSRLVIAGYSAGGQLAALAATAPGVFRADDLDAELGAADPSPTAALIVAGPSDLTVRAERWSPAHERAGPFSTCAQTRSMACWKRNARIASPSRWLDADAPPAMLIYGAHDTFVDAEAHGRA